MTMERPDLRKMEDQARRAAKSTLNTRPAPDAGLASRLLSHVEFLACHASGFDMVKWNEISNDFLEAARILTALSAAQGFRACSGLPTSTKAPEMTDAFAPAIAALQSDLADLERKARELKSTVNVLCKHAGMAELYPNVDAETSGPSIASIRADTFYGKVINTAAREYLEMRKAAGLGPATPREIYDAMVAGGFQFDAKNDQIALVSLRSNLRKNSKTFHKLPNGQYGLLSWYPNAKPAKATDGDDGDGKTAADDKPTAEDDSSEAPANLYEGGASEHPEEGD